MRFILENWYLFALALASGGALAWPALRRGTVGGAGVSAAEAVRLLNREKAVLIDVSEPGEYAAAHLAGSRNVPLGRLDASKELPGNKSLPVILVCASGNRAARAARALRAKGHEKAVALDGGLAAWRSANLPLESKS